MKKEVHIAVSLQRPQRLQEYGVGIFSMCESKSGLKKALKKQRILVNGKLATTATMISGGESIECIIPETSPINHKYFELNLEVVYEDEFLAVIHKPAGVLVNGNGFKTIQNALIQNLLPSAEPDAVSPKTIHRLDFPTTGLLLCGKTASSIVRLNEMFAEKEILKQYYAVTMGSMPPSGVINADVDDREAESTFETQASVTSVRFETLNLVKLNPKTGRRHQLRKHMAGIGNPILGDATYGKKGLVLKGKGLYLHAYSLQFIHPVSGEKLKIEKAPPEKFSKIFPDHLY